MPSSSNSAIERAKPINNAVVVNSLAPIPNDIAALFGLILPTITTASARAKKAAPNSLNEG